MKYNQNFILNPKIFLVMSNFTENARLQEIQKLKSMGFQEPMFPSTAAETQKLLQKFAEQAQTLQETIQPAKKQKAPKKRAVKQVFKVEKVTRTATVVL